MIREPFIENLAFRRSTSGTLLDQLAEREEIVWVQQAVRQLSEEEYQLLCVRHKLDPLAPTAAAFAECLGCSRKTVYPKAKKALQHLAALLHV